VPVPDPVELLELAETLAVQAGHLLVSRRPEHLSVTTKSSPTDVVTAMDRASEQLIIEGVHAARPDDAIVAEEGGGGTGTSGVRWIIDPLDGTVNYLYGIPQYAVSIAAEVDGSVQAAVVHDPAKSQTFVATLGGGSFCNGEKLGCSASAALDQALIGTGFGYRQERRAAQARVVVEMLPRVRDIRRMGAAALDLCAVAAGQLDGFYERGLAAWDLAAGRLVATEAGAVVGGLAGREPGPDLVIAAGPALFPSLERLLRDLGADRD
jgi:myo-inositol-1(or 4)-monophosphatase